MGNNKKTVKCSFCNRLGHNRVTCEKLSDLVEENRKRFGSAHPDVVEHDNYKKRYSDKSRTNANRIRHCSYCHSQRHNIRTCSERQKNLTKVKKLNVQWRNGVLRELREKGIGMGSIMVNHSYISNTENQKSPWTLVSIDWDNMNWIVDNKKVFRLILMSNPTIYREITLEQILNDSVSYAHRWDVLSKSEKLDYPDRWAVISDPTFDQKCVELFKHINKNDYDMLFIQFHEKPIKYMYINQEELYDGD